MEGLGVIAHFYATRAPLRCDLLVVRLGVRTASFVKATVLGGAKRVCGPGERLPIGRFEGASSPRAWYVAREPIPLEVSDVACGSRRGSGFARWN